MFITSIIYGISDSCVRNTVAYVSSGVFRIVQ